MSKYGIKKAAVFGSVAKGEQKKNSDIDILIEYDDENNSLLDFIKLKFELEKKIGRRVDLVEYCALRSRIKDKILREQISIL